MPRWLQPNPHQARLLATALAVVLPVGWSSAFGQGGDQAADPGEALFDSYCSACHQYDDQGMGEAPPLDNSPWVNGPPDRIVRIILHGVEGRIEIGGRTYDREMPGFGSVLSDQQVATLATYTRARFGTRLSAVAVEEVERIRQENAGRTAYWSADELLNVR